MSIHLAFHSWTAFNSNLRYWSAFVTAHLRMGREQTLEQVQQSTANHHNCHGPSLASSQVPGIKSAVAEEMPLTAGSLQALCRPLTLTAASAAAEPPRCGMFRIMAYASPLPLMRRFFLASHGRTCTAGACRSLPTAATKVRVASS